MFILFYISEAYSAWRHFLHNVGCEFPHQNKIDCFTYVTETERSNDWVYLYDIFTEDFSHDKLWWKKGVDFD